MKSIKQLRESNLEEASVHLDNPFDSKHGPDHKSETKHADMMKKNHGVTTKYHRDSGEMSYHGPKKNLKAALHTHYQTDNADEIKDNHPDLYEESSGHESVLAAKASAAATRDPSKENHLKAVAAHKNAQGFFKGRSHDYHLNMAVKHAEKAATFKEGTKESVDLPNGTDLNEASGYKQHSGTAAMHSQAAKDNPSISTHIKAANSHEKASNSHSRKLDKLIRNKASAADLAPHETMVKQHDKQVVMHKFMAHRLIKKHMNEAVEIAEDVDSEKNIKITQHSQEAIAAEKRGDKQAQQFHLAIVAKLKNESVTEGTEQNDGEEEVSMAKSQLLKVVDMAKDLADAMDDEDELEAWIQNKITTAYNELDDVHSYVEYGEDLQDEKYDAADKDTPMDESVIAEETEDGEETAGMSDDEKKSLARLQALIRLGLLDRQRLPIIARAIKKLDTEMPINNIAEKMALFELLHSMIAIVTGDTSVFAKVRSSVIRK